MTTYIVRRLLITIPVLFGVIVLVFAITRILPGDPCRILLGERATDAACNVFSHAHGLDLPISQQFANLGVSIPVFVLGLLLAFTFAILLKGTPFALPPSGRLTPGLSVVPLAVRWGLQNDHGILRAIVDFLSNMYTVNGLLSAQWGLFLDALRHLILPAVALGTIPLAIIARITRSSLLDVLGLDYVRTARAKGLSDGRVVRKHALPNAMLPMVTIIGLQIGGLLSGAVLTETIFGLPGVGQATYDAITSHDFAVIEGFVLVIALAFLVINLIVDISYAYLDPRLRPS